MRVCSLIPTILLSAAITLIPACIPSAPTLNDDDSAQLPDAAPATFVHTPATIPTAADSQPLPETEEELLAEWRELAKDPQKNQIGMRPILLAASLAQKHNEALNPLIDIIADPQASPYEKVFVVHSLATVIGPPYLERLATLVGPEYDTTTRACATRLIADVESPAAVPILESLKDDSDRRVSLSAIIGLDKLGDRNAHQALVEWYHEKDTTYEERIQIVLIFLQNPSPEHFPILAEALVDPELDDYMRANIALVFGRLGGDNERHALEQSIQFADSNEYRNMAQAAIQAINARAAANQTGGNL